MPRVCVYFSFRVLLRLYGNHVKNGGLCRRKTLDRRKECVKLFAVRNLGVKSIAEIRRLILEYGYAQASDRRKKEFLHRLVQLNSKK